MFDRRFFDADTGALNMDKVRRALSMNIPQWKEASQNLPPEASGTPAPADIAIALKRVEEESR